MQRSVLILGGSRFHGYELVKHFCKIGFSVSVLNRGNYRKEYPKGVKHLICDRNDAKAFSEIVKDQYYDCVIDNNCYSDQQMRLSLSCLDNRVEQYIFTSSVAIYKKLSSETPCSEDMNLDNSSSELYDPQVLKYAEEKLAAEKVLIESNTSFAYTILRVPNIFGPTDIINKVEYFWARLNDSGKFILEDGINEFSLIFIDDLIKAFSRICLNPKVYYQVLNVADKHIYTLKTFFSDLFGDLWDTRKVCLISVANISISCFSMPFVWGAAVTTEKYKQLCGDVLCTPVRKWLAKWDRAALEKYKNSKSYTDKRAEEISVLSDMDLYAFNR